MRSTHFKPRHHQLGLLSSSTATPNENGISLPGVDLTELINTLFSEPASQDK